MTERTNRPLPALPPDDSPQPTDPYYYRPNLYFPAYPFPPFFTRNTCEPPEEPRTTLRGGTLLHKGFYDLLAMIPAPSPSRFFWGAPVAEPVIAGPRYEDISPSTNSPPPPPPPPPQVTPSSPPKKGRRISKDMVSKPTGFVHLVHASDAEQLEALLTRWGPDGQGKIGDPQWANPIKIHVREINQAKAVNEVVNALKPTFAGTLDAQLRVVNGMSGTTSSTLTTAARENFPISASVDGLPGRPGHSTLRWGGGLQTHLELREHEDGHSWNNNQILAVPPEPKPFTPSLATLEKVVAARIYFENVYFPLLRHTPPRDQRRLALERDMIAMRLTENQKEYLRFKWLQNETAYLREKRRKVDVNAFVKLKTIGHGAFGVVSLVREKSDGQLYAMKELRKTDMLRKAQEGHVRAERDLLKYASLVSSPTQADWIVRLHYSFQDRDHLYLVLEYMGGGDLLNLLIERDVFEENFTRFYVAEMILAIESCHTLGFIHRDIKPDNFLFDPEGHIKLSDFGLATDLHWAHDTSYYEQQRLHLFHKHGIDLQDGNALTDGSKTKRLDRKEVERLMGGGEGSEGVFTWRERHRRLLAYSVCGTNSYMSPEVIRGHGYSYSCDWWSLGVIMFECLYGYPPFISNSRHVTRQKILNWKTALRFPPKPRVSHEGVNLMQQLLCEPEDRLGSQASASVSRPNSVVMQARRSAFLPAGTGGSSVDGAEHIKAHPWFRGIDWMNIRRYPAPYRPQLRSADDTQHFDPDIPPEPLAPANGAPADATRDPVLGNKLHGEEVLKVRKALAFAGFTHKSPRTMSYIKAEQAFDSKLQTYGQHAGERGRQVAREVREVGKGRAISM